MEAARPVINGDEDEENHLDNQEEAATAASKKATKTKTVLKSKSGKTVDSPKKPARKLKADAHANYRRLKIKSKNSNGNGRRSFGRRR
jgi:hypothetical protein